MSHPYPDEPAGPFAAPPRSVEDREGRTIELRPYGDADDREALVEMYREFDPADRAQGIPPIEPDRIREWLDVLLEGSEDAEGHNVLAWHGDRAVGHATLVPDGDGGHELAIFVHQAYQGAGIGSALIRALLGLGAERGVERVWLTVERWNRAAIGLYESVGFEVADSESFEVEMTLRLDPGE